MSTRRRPLLAAVLLAAPLALASCGKKKNTEETQPPLAPVTDASGGGGGSPGKAGQPNPSIERITVAGSVETISSVGRRQGRSSAFTSRKHSAGRYNSTDSGRLMKANDTHSSARCRARDVVRPRSPRNAAKKSAAMK